jgi:hypothetical protein
MPVRELCFLGIALRSRSGIMADEAVNEALWDICDREPEARRVYVVGQVNYRNKASMRMLERSSFIELSRGVPPPNGNGRLGWWLRILRPQQPSAASA